MTDQPQNLQLAWWAKKFDDVDRELAQLAIICQVRLFDPGVIERVLKNDATVCGAPNPPVFGKLRSLLMMHYAIRDKAVAALGGDRGAGLDQHRRRATAREDRRETGRLGNEKTEGEIPWITASAGHWSPESPQCWRSRSHPSRRRSNGSRPSRSPSSCRGRPAGRPTRSRASPLPKSRRRSARRCVVVNQPGASGSIGTKNALEAPKDGYTWTAGAAQDLGTYAVLGMLDTKIGDWALFLNVANVSTLSVNPNTPYKTPTELIDAMKAKPGAISVATAGVNSSGHSAMEAIAKATGVKYKHVTYDGGNPAVVATVAGETDATTQLTAEQAEMIRGKKLRPLAVIGDKPVELDGYGIIEPLTKSVPGFKAPANYFGIFIPKGVPPEVIATVEKIWAEQIASSAALKQYATSRGAQFAPLCRRRRAEGGVPGGAGQRVVRRRHRQGEGRPGHAGHPAPVSAATPWAGAFADAGLSLHESSLGHRDPPVVAAP